MVAREGETKWFNVGLLMRHVKRKSIGTTIYVEGRCYYFMYLPPSIPSEHAEAERRSFQTSPDLTS